jgi:hypothetical protein
MQLPETSVDFLFGFDAKKGKVEYRFTIFPTTWENCKQWGGKCELKFLMV